MRNTMRTILVWLFLAGVLLASAQALLGKREDKQLINYSQFIQQVNKGEVAKVDIEGTLLSGYVIKGERTDKSKFYTNAPMDDKLLTMLQEKNVDFRYIPEEKPGLWSNIFFTSLLPVLLLIGAWFYFLRMQNGGGGKGGAFSFGKSRARLLDKPCNLRRCGRLRRGERRSAGNRGLPPSAEPLSEPGRSRAARDFAGW